MLTVRQRLLFLAPLALILIPFLLWPTGFGFLAIFTNYGPAQRQVHWVGVANFAGVLGNQQFRAAGLNITGFTIVSVTAEIAIGLALAYLLREPLRGRGLLQVGLPGLLAISPDQWEQARLDGAPLFSRIRHGVLPGVWPLLLTVTLLLVGDALGTFDTVLILTGGGPGSETLTPGLYSYQQAFQVNNWPLGAPSAWLIVAALVLCAAAYLYARRPRTR